MSDSSSDILKASHEKLAGVFGLGRSEDRVWRPEELAAVFRHQMNAPVMVDLAGVEPALSGKLKTLCEAEGLVLKSFGDLFAHPQPPLELLRLVKEFAKANRSHVESVLPPELASVLYYLAIAAASVRWGGRISALGEHELRRGFDWALGQSWIDRVSRELLERAKQGLPSAGKPG